MRYGICCFFIMVFLAASLFAIQVVELPDISKPHLIRVEKDRLFIVEGTTVFIYSLQDFHVIEKFGRQGEGPGELKSFVSSLEVGADYILINSSGRLSWFSRNGKFLKQKKDVALGHNYKILGEGFVGMRMLREKDGIYFSVNIFDSDLNKIREIHRYRHPFFSHDRKINPVNLRMSSYFVCQKKIYLDMENGIIQVFDQKGEHLYSVTCEFPTVKMTPEKREKSLKFWKSDLKAEYEVYKERLEFPATFPVIKDLQVADDNIYVITHREKMGKNELIILGLKGELIKKTWVALADVNMLLPHLLNYYTIQNHRIYKLVDNADKEIWELHISKLQ